jgi:multiple sugar transport system ATP-binding protein
MSKVELIHLAKRFGHVPAVEDLSLEVAEGEFLVLVGSSGSGKSTVLRMIAGLEEPTAGEIRIGGRRVNELSPKDRDLAMVFQSYALYPHMTVRENLGFALNLRRMPRADVTARVQETAAALGLDTLLDRKPAALSGGQRQRVALGRAIVRKPQVFLFDEPLSNLDAKLRTQMRAELADLHHRLGATMIYVTHDQVEAMTLGDRIAVMEGGRLQQVAPPLALYERPANRFVASFIGSPSMNWLEGTVSNSVRFESGATIFQLPLAIATAAARAGRVACGIRPEVLALATPGAPHATPRLAGILRLVERLGAETFLHVEPDSAQAGTSPATARSPLIVMRLLGGQAPELESRIELTFDPSAAHYFALPSGERLG